MRNLKKMLSLVMALAMVASFMVVGASAQFSDDKDIQNKDAVETLVSLGVIKGRDTGAFDPAGIVTRAEMAKMICVAMAGGKDPTMAGTGMYPDTKNHWAAGYIDYCTNMGYVAGNPDGNFYPDKTVTGTEAAKMILTIIGYNAETENFVNNANWEININAIASTKGIYDDVSVIPNAGLTRDNAAQMIYNGLQASMVKYELVGIVGGNGVAKADDILDASGNGVTLLSKKFNLDTGYGYMTAISYDSDKGEYTYDLASAGNFGSGSITGSDAIGTVSVKSTKDYSDLYGMKIRMLFKTDANSKITVYGIYSTDSAILASGVVGDISVKAADTSFKIDGTSYKLTDAANATPVYEYNNGSFGTVLSGNLSAAEAFAYDLVDNTGDGKGDLIVVHPIVVAKVTFVGKDAITASNVSYKFSDCTIYEDVAKNDYVVVTPAANTKDDTVSIVKADKITGDVEAQKVADNEYRVDGVWYTKASGASISINTGDNVELAVVNGYVYFAKVVEGTTVSDVLYVVDTEAQTKDTVIAPSLGGTDKGIETLVLLPDGTKATVNSMRVDTTDSSSGAAGDMTPISPAPGLYTYKLNKDKVYELKAVKGTGSAQFGSTGVYSLAAANQPGGSTYAAATGFYVKSTGKLDGKVIADDAVIYLIDSSTPKYKVVTGKDLKTMQDFGSAAAYLTKAVNGLTTVKVAFISEAAAFSNTEASTGYGYVTSGGYAQKNADGDWLVKFTVWDGTQSVELTATDATAASDADNAEFAKGAFITYTNSATAGEVTGADEIGDPVAITGYDNAQELEYWNGSAITPATLKDDDKSVVIYVNTADKKGIEGGSITTVDDLSDDGSNVYTMNAVIEVAGGEVDVLFVDTNNRLETAVYDVTTVTTANITGNNVTYASTAKKGDGTTLASGNDLKGGESITVTVTPSGTASASATKVITVTMTLADATTVVKTLTFTETISVENTTAQTLNFTMPYQAVTSIVVS